MVVRILYEGKNHYKMLELELLSLTLVCRPSRKILAEVLPENIIV